MEVVEKKMWVPYSPSCVYQLVCNIQDYPLFLPWCSHAQILRRLDSIVEASLTLRKGGISKSFVTRNIMVENEQIEMHLLSGPFKHLYGIWKFEARDQGVEVSLHLEFSFDSLFFSKMMGPLFQPIANTLLEAFMKRAAEVCPLQ